MQKLTPVLILALLVALSIYAIVRERAKQPPPLSLAQTIRRIHVEGMQRADLVRHGPTATDSLLAWLADPAWSKWRGNVVRAIGVIGRGRDGDVAALLAFLEEGDGSKLSYAEYAAKQAVLPALGNIAHFSGSQPALDFLLRNALPSRWPPARFAKWQSPYGESPRFLRGHFAKLTIIGLGMTGTSEAGDLLTELKKPPGADTTPADAKFKAASRTLIDEAIERNARRRSTRAP